VLSILVIVKFSVTTTCLTCKLSISVHDCGNSGHKIANLDLKKTLPSKSDNYKQSIRSRYVFYFLLTSQGVISEEIF